jgi:hypothetical protein
MMSDEHTTTEVSPDEPLATDGQMTLSQWRATRPVYGALAMIVGGLLIAWPSLQFLVQASLLESSSTVSLGVIVGALAVFTGGLALVRPDRSTALGAAACALSAVSFVVAFGGLLVGMLAVGLGGVLCFAFRPPGDDPSR